MHTPGFEIVERLVARPGYVAIQVYGADIEKDKTSIDLAVQEIESSIVKLSEDTVLDWKVKQSRRNCAW